MMERIALVLLAFALFEVCFAVLVGRFIGHAEWP